ncbi:biotin--[acetyl-CoA-carboxylase] ligase [Mycoplasmatota bacterium WC44]
MLGKKIIEFDRIDSTNNYIKLNIDKLDTGTIVISKHQSSGYGRMKRTWYDDGSNLTFSVLLKLSDTKRITLLTQVAAASVRNALSELGFESHIKWPNDILVNDKKICGILLESILDDKEVNVILGIGLNVNMRDFDLEIKNKATSMFLESNEEFQLYDVLNKIIVNLNKYYECFLKGRLDYLDVCRKHSYVIGKFVMLDSASSKKVLVKGIDDEGRLIVDINGEEVTYYGSEVSLSSIYRT